MPLIVVLLQVGLGSGIGPALDVALTAPGGAPAVVRDRRGSVFSDSDDDDADEDGGIGEVSGGVSDF